MKSSRSFKMHQRESSALLLKLLRAETKDELGELLSSEYCNYSYAINGENELHILARYAPNLLKEYAFAKNIIHLMKVPNNNGVYPLEYFLCFADSNTITNQTEDFFSLSKRLNPPNPDWLRVKLLIVENKASYSGVDSAPLSIWKQKNPEDFRKCLKSPCGANLIKRAANDFKYNADDVYCGMNFNRYTNFSNEEFSFFELAQTKDEVQVSLMQSWRVFYSDHTHYYNSEKGWEFLKNTVNNLIHKSINLDVDIISIRDKMIRCYNAEKYSYFDSFMAENVNFWHDFRTIIDRQSLLNIVANYKHEEPPMNWAVL